MKLRSYRTVLFALFALFLGAGQGLCSSLSPGFSCTTNVAISHHHATLERQDTSAHDYHQTFEPDEPTQRLPHDKDCSICSSTYDYKALAKSKLNLTINTVPSVMAVASEVLTPDISAGNTQKKPIARLWRGQRSQTPVALKIRLLI